MNEDIIHDDIDFEKEDNDKDPEGTKEEQEEEEDEDEAEEEDCQGDGEGYEEDEDEDEDEKKNEESINNNIIVKNKYTNQSHGVDDIQKLPLNWFQNVRQNYKQNNIIPRKKEVTISEQAFRDVKKKIL